MNDEKTVGLVAFKTTKKGYDPEQVDEFVRAVEEKLQEKAAQLEALQKRVDELEATPVVPVVDAKPEEDFELNPSAAQKVALYDKLMEKMEGDYTNLLIPAVTKAKTLEEQARKEYQVRIDQARHSADGIYAEAAERINGAVSSAVDNNMERIYDLIDNFIYSRSFLGRVESFMKGCKTATTRVAEALYTASKVPGKAANNVKEAVGVFRDEFNAKLEARKKAMNAYNETMNSDD